MADDDKVEFRLSGLERTVDTLRTDLRDADRFMAQWDLGKWILVTFSILSASAIAFLIKGFDSLDAKVVESKAAIEAKTNEAIGKVLNSSHRLYTCFNAKLDATKRKTQEGTEYVETILKHGNLIRLDVERDKGETPVFYQLSRNGTWVTIKQDGVYIVSITAVTQRTHDEGETYQINDVDIGVVTHSDGEPFDVDTDNPFVSAIRGQGLSVPLSASGIAVTGLRDGAVLGVEPFLGAAGSTKAALRSLQFCLARL